MNKNDIKLGQCYLARLSKSDIPVRLEKNDPAGGWIARSLTHGRILKIKSDTQLLEPFNANKVRGIAKETTPNRRSRIKGTVRKPPTSPISETGTPAPPKKPKRKSKPASPVIIVRMNAKNAAYRVLKESNRPMTTREIVAVCVEQGYWVTEAATPHATLHAALSREINNDGDASRFVKGERGKFFLR